MKNNERISELLVETGAFTDLEKPVILASGDLGIYFINTEKLCQDGGKFKEYGNNSQAMVKHSLNMMEEHPTFKEVIDILAERAYQALDETTLDCTISGKISITSLNVGCSSII